MCAVHLHFSPYADLSGMHFWVRVRLRLCVSLSLDSFEYARDARQVKCNIICAAQTYVGSLIKIILTIKRVKLLVCAAAGPSRSLPVWMRERWMPRRINLNFLTVRAQCVTNFGCIRLSFHANACAVSGVVPMYAKLLCAIGFYVATSFSPSPYTHVKSIFFNLTKY